MQTRCPSLEQLQDLVADGLTGAAAETVEAHVEACPSCQHALEQLTAGSPTPARGEAAAAFLRELERAVPDGWQRPTDAPGPTHNPAPTVPLFPAAPAPEELPVVAGYEVLRELGRGGMGVVYLARQVALKRLVALKMLLAGPYADAEGRARFRAEAEAVARLQHPHIVQIYEIGEQAGRPFFALEYVAGGSLAERLAGTPQPARAAAQLAEALARAVHAAHERGIVHRDLKPANILLAVVSGQWSVVSKDGKASSSLTTDHWPLTTVPKITDFGLAKQLDVDVGQTPSGTIVGTPSYMAPEQALGKARQVGPAADVYALGAILYEVLTGRPPFQGETPLDTVNQVLAGEAVPPRRLQPKVPVDLETICLKCLQKEPGQRYASALALAEDLRRFLAGEPIRARPVGPAGRLWRWCRRQPALAGLTAAVAVALLAGTGVASYFAVQATERAREALAQQLKAEDSARLARQEQERAQTSLEFARQALDEMTSLVIDDLLGRQPELTDDHKQYLRKTLTYYEQFARETGADEVTRYRVAWAHNRTGIIRSRLGQRREAEAAFRQAVGLYKQLAADFPAVPTYREGAATNANNLGRELEALGRHADAEAAYRQALGLYERLAADFPKVPGYRHRAANTQNNLGVLLGRSGRRAEAVDAFRHNLALRERLAADFPKVPDYRQELARSHHNLAGRLRELGEHRDAEAGHRQALALRAKLVADFPKVPQYRYDLASSHNGLAVLLVAAGRRSEAEAAYRQALALYERLAIEFPAVPAYREQWAGSYHNLALLLRASGRPADAETAQRQALALREKLAADFPAVPKYRQSWANSSNSLGILLEVSGRPAEAETAYRQALALRAKLVADFPAVPAYAVDLGGSYCNLADLVRDRGEPAAALEWYARAIGTLEPLYARDSRLPNARQFLQNAHHGRANALTRLNRHAEALPDWDRAIALAAGPTASREGARRLRALALARLKEHARATAEADELAKAKDARAVTFVILARVYALSTAAAAEDTARSEAYAARAVALLRQAVAQGFTDAGQLQTDADLEALRERADFQQLLRDLEQPAPPKGP